jgi:cytochrome c peroxidase
MPSAKALITFSILAALATVGPATANEYTLSPGHESLKAWLLPERPQHPEGNAPNKDREELGKMLFFDPRLSGDGNMSCATCHSPMFGWSDGLPTARGSKSQVLARATPTVTNTGYNTLQMWDGRKKSLEDQAMGPMEANVEMNTDLDALFRFLNSNREYRLLFNRAYPGQKIDPTVVAKAIAAFERTVLSNNSPFDRWVRGDASAMTQEQVRGLAVFVAEDKGNCAGCHSAPNFTDDGFHNIGLESWGAKTPDMGRYAQKPLNMMKGAFKTPTLRDIALSSPYFHDGSAASLMDVVEHYAKGGAVKTNLSPSMKALTLSRQEKADLVAFLKALTTE